MRYVLGVSRWSIFLGLFHFVRPQVTEDDSKAAAMPIFCEVTHQNQAVLDETQMRAASLHRFLKKRKVR